MRRPAEVKAGWRAARVPLTTATRLVSMERLQSVGAKMFREWEKMGSVPPDKLCGLLIERLEHEGKKYPLEEPHVAVAVNRVRAIARRTGAKGPTWDIVEAALRFAEGHGG